VARAAALIGAARAYVLACTAGAWQAARAGDGPTLEQRAQLRLALTHAVQSAAAAVDLLYDLGGATSIYVTSPLERCFRDIHVATQHALVATGSYEVAGQALLGLDPGPALVL
jgi:alkylation response protein AidB-like acyl-CoA dehydrogenase